MNISDYILNVPSSILKQSFQEKLVGPLRLWLWLKYQSSGKLYITNGIARRAATELRISERTFWNHIHLLTANGFINKSGRSGITFIYGFKRYCKDVGLSVKWRGMIFQREILDKQNFRAWVFSMLIYRIIRTQRAHAVAKYGDATSKRAPSVNQMRVAYGAKILNVSPATVSRYKKYVQKFGYLSYRPSLVKIANYAPKPGKYLNAPVVCIKGKGAFLRKPDAFAFNQFKLAFKK